MSNMKALYQSNLHSLPLLSRGKVRDCYAVGEDKILMITTDRLSAFDVIMNEPIPGKGIVLNQMSLFWFDWLKKHFPHLENHLTGIDPETVVASDELDQVRSRAVVVKRLQPILVEAVVRGYLLGSGWKDYQTSGQVCGISLPAQLRLAERLPQALFTPAAKADVGLHDENIDFAEVEKRIGHTLAQKIKHISLAIYQAASEFALTKGIIIADTKFEFGLDQKGTLYLMDEVLTADSSRLWPMDAYQVGISPPSFDKQFVRDYLETVPNWNKQAPAPKLPEEVITKTAAKYQEALERLTRTTS